MPQLTPEQEEALDAALLADTDDPDAWEEEPPLPPQPDKRFSRQLSLRLPPDSAERLVHAAAERGIGSTTLARQLIEEGLRALEQGSRVLVELTVQPDGEVRAARVA